MIQSETSGSRGLLAMRQRFAQGGSVFRESVKEEYFKVDVLCDAQRLLGWSTSQVAEAMNISLRTLKRKLETRDALTPHMADLLMDLLHIYDQGLAYFGEEAKWHAWVQTPNESLGGVTPSSLMTSISGRRDIANALYAMAYGNCV